jgi:hypothetical protein
MKNIIKIGLGAIAFGAILACGGSPSKDIQEPAAPQEPGTVQTATAPAPAGTINEDGIYLIPSEVRAGTYRATVPEDSYGCYWARLRGTSGDLDEIITNANGEPKARMTVTIKSSDKAFETTGCGAWKKVN